ncbi:MAG: hypothetical protein ACI4Q3_01305 [Kiritimatiellia bacterium]
METRNCPFDLAILAHGDPPAGPALAVLRAVPALIACDGAYAVAVRLGREPDLTVGDGDSLDPATRRQLGARFVHVGEQATNDLAKAFRTARVRYPHARRIVLLGAGGGREDHLLDNVFRLPGFAREIPGIVMMTNAGRFGVVARTRRFRCRAGDPVSVFAPYPDTHVESRGLQWPLDGVDLSELCAAAHNCASGDAFRLKTNRPILVYRPFPTAG